MSREIKFRAWDEKDKVMYVPKVINLWLDFMGHAYYFDGKFKVANDLKVMQYTGLKDKNGKEIFEGDVVRYLDGNEWSTESGYDCEEFDNFGVIFFDEECGRYDVTNKQGIGYDDLFDCGVDFEIIGNIFEHSHLLEGDINA